MIMTASDRRLLLSHQRLAGTHENLCYKLQGVRPWGILAGVLVVVSVQQYGRGK